MGDWYNPFSWTKQSGQASDQVANLNESGNQASNFADTGQQGFGALGQEAQAAREGLRQMASGQNSLSSEQLRQGLQQNLGAQRSLAAGASPQNAAMAARTAAIQSANLGSGFAGQQAMAGIAERSHAQELLNQMIMQQRQQDLQAALGSRQNAISGYGGIKPEGSTLDKMMPLIGAAAGVAGAKFGAK